MPASRRLHAQHGRRGRTGRSLPRHTRPGGLAAAPPARCAVAGFLTLFVVAALAVLPRARPANADVQRRDVSPVAQDRRITFSGELQAATVGPGLSQPPLTSGGAATPTPLPPADPSALAADGIPETALIAYQNAASRETVWAPQCHLNWTLLAAIGRVESNHGRFGGATLYADGRSYPKIIGIALDGVGTALIRDTDHGRLDGDTVYDHAVGPMQFIPSTWARYGVDVDGDGVADPFDIFDATAAAADYLCAVGADLSTAAGQYRAVYAYNHDDSYVRTVMALAADYAQGVPGLTLSVLPPATGPAPQSSPTPATSSPAAAGTSPSDSPGGSGSGSASGSPGDSSSASGGPSDTASGSPSDTTSAGASPRPTDCAPTQQPSTTPAPSDSASPTPAPSDSASPTDSPSPTPTDCGGGSTTATGSDSPSPTGSDSPSPTPSSTQSS